MTMMQMLLMATSSLTPLPDAYLDLNFASNSYRLADAASSFAAAFTQGAITGDEARTQITDTYGWTITDGGTAP